MNDGTKTRGFGRGPRPVGILLVAAAVAAAFALGLLVRGGAGDGAPAAGTAGPAAAERWTCSMHPQIILPSNDQQCPICFMDLIPLEEDASEGLAPGDLALSEAAAALADVATAPVARRFVTRPVRLVGKIAADETRTGTITARVAGRIDRLLVDATGQVVRAGDPLAEIYSPELYTAQAELRAAATAAASADEDGALAGSAAATLAAARERLRLWGLDRAAIDAIETGRGGTEHVTVSAPGSGVVVRRLASEGDFVRTGAVLYEIADLSRVWATLEAFESDLSWLREGQDVVFTARAYPGRTFDGTVAFMDPVLDERTRTVEVRVEVENAGGLLKPGMLVSGVVEAALDADGVPVTDPENANPPLVVPASAPLLTGKRAVVYVASEGDDGPVFSGREVRLGPRAGDHFLVVSGLEEGEEVVVRGAFKIDSALQILARPSMMDPAGAGAPGHDHHGDRTAAPVAALELDPADVPACAGATLETALPAYYELQAALAADDDDGAAAAAVRLGDALSADACDDQDLADDAAGAWKEALAGLSEAAGGVVAAEGIDARRLAFEPVSDGLWRGLSLFVPDRADTVRRFHCPMAMDGAGAYWLQPGDVTANPYYGASMLRCGSQVETLGGPDGGGE